MDPVLRDRDAHLLEMGTSSWWVVNPDVVRRRGIWYAVPLYRGVTRGLFRIREDGWEQEPGNARRWGFVSDPVRPVRCLTWVGRTATGCPAGSGSHRTRSSTGRGDGNPGRAGCLGRPWTPR